MRFLKASIIILFVVSLLSAGVTFYLSTIRENEKAKRLYLEERVGALESEKTKLEQNVTGLELEKQNLTQKFDKEIEAHRRDLDLSRTKDADLERLRGEASQAEKAFQNAQKRNQELERILDELESRMRQVESQKNISGPEASYVEVSVTPASPHLSNPIEIPSGTAAPTVEPVQPRAPTPITVLPQPPKRRRLPQFFRFLNGKKSESLGAPAPATSAPEQATTQVKYIPETDAPPPVTESSQVKLEVPKAVGDEAVTRAPDEARVRTDTAQLPKQKQQAELARKTDQTIAAGSVLLVNRKYNFIVTNLGSRQGLGLDDVLMVQKKGVEVAKVRVEKLYDDYSAAYIVEEQSEHPIGEGDAVTAA